MAERRKESYGSCLGMARSACRQHFHRLLPLMSARRSSPRARLLHRPPPLLQSPRRTPTRPNRTPPPTPRPVHRRNHHPRHFPGPRTLHACQPRRFLTRHPLFEVSATYPVCAQVSRSHSARSSVAFAAPVPPLVALGCYIHAAQVLHQIHLQQAHLIYPWLHVATRLV